MKKVKRLAKGVIAADDDGMFQVDDTAIQANVAKNLLIVS